MIRGVSQTKENFSQMQYNKMMDDSKQTEEADISRSDFTETHGQETLRNFQKSGKEGSHAQIDMLDLRKVAAVVSGGVVGQDGYQNLPEEDHSQRNPKERSNSKNRKNFHSQGGNPDGSINHQVYSQEEEKTHDLIKHDLYQDEEEYDEYRKGSSSGSHHQERRVHTDGMGASFDHIISNQQPGDLLAEKKGVKKIGSFQMKAHLPYLKLNAPLALSSNDIFEIFANISKAQRFQVIEMEQNIATAVNKEPFSIKRMFMRCLPFQEFKREQTQESFISAIRLQISVNEVKCCRKIALKGLYGEYNRLQEFSNSFRNRIHDYVSALPDDKKIILNSSNNSSNPNIKTGGKSGKKSISSNKVVTTLGALKGSRGHNQITDEDSDEENKKFNEASSLYQIHKILSSEQYTLGKNVAQYLDAFHLQYRSLRESAALLPQPMEGLMALVNETVHTFHSEYNLGKETAKSLMPYCRPAVEKFVFSKLYDKIFAMYAIKNEEEDRLFIERSGVIKRIKPQEVMIYLGIRDKFILGDSSKESTRPQMFGPNTSMDQSKMQSYNSAQRESNVGLYMKGSSESKDQIIDTSSSQYESHRSAELQYPPLPSATGSESHYVFNNSSTSSSLGLGVLNRQDLPYYDAIKCIEKIQQFQSPREKLQCINESFSCLKTAIVDYWKGKIELNAMDDVLPLTIYAVAMADLTHPVSEYNIMDDYLSLYDKGFEIERKLLTNFDVSIKYVNHEWQLPQP